MHTTYLIERNYERATSPDIHRSHPHCPKSGWTHICTSILPRRSFRLRCGPVGTTCTASITDSKGNTIFEQRDVEVPLDQRMTATEHRGLEVSARAARDTPA